MLRGAALHGQAGEHNNIKREKNSKAVWAAISTLS